MSLQFAGRCGIVGASKATTNPTPNMNVKIYTSRDGNLVGQCDIDEARMENAVESCEGHFRADAVIDDEDLRSLGLDGSESVYAMTL
jgi:hypothetical protein